MSSQDPKGVTTTYTYNSAGNRLTESTPLAGSSPAQTQTITYTYGDSAHPGDVTAVQDPNGKTTTNTYDANGDLASVTDPLGNTTTNSYDGIGRRTSTVSARGNASGANPADYTTAYTYDAAGNKLSETDPLGNTASSTYDDAGNLTSSTDADNHTTTYVYDAADQQTEIHRPDSSVLKSSYDADGNLTSQTDGATNSTSYAYDALDREISKLDPLNRQTAYGYDAAGNQTTVTDALNRTTTKNYDAANRLTSIGYSDGVTAGATFGYDADDQRTSMIDGTGTSSWTYDSLHRVTQYINGHGDALSYGYDLAGNKTRITYPGSHIVTYSYDNAGRMTGLTDWLSHTTSFGYDRDSEQTSATFPSATGNVDTYTYDHAGRQTSTSFAQGSTTLASLDYTRDAKGLLTHVDSTGLPGTASHTYSYTSLAQLAADNSDTYAYDAADNPTTLAGVSGGSFDAANQLNSNAGGSFTYDALGERTSSTPTGGAATNYGYDQAGRLTSFTPSSGSSATYTYDGTGLRASKTVGTATKQFLWDLTGSLPLMLHDGSTSYLYGPDGTVSEQISSGGTPSYYHHDQLGSTRALTDASGAVTGTFTYSPFGTLAASTGTQTTPFGFAGEYTDAETGFLYLRARYYDPATGEFVTVDPLVTFTRQPYGYSDDDPVNGSDPLGLRRRHHRADPGFAANVILLPVEEGEVSGRVTGHISHRGPVHKPKVGTLRYSIFINGELKDVTDVPVGRGGRTVDLGLSGVSVERGDHVEVRAEVTYRGTVRAEDDDEYIAGDPETRRRPKPRPAPGPDGQVQIAA